MKLRVIRGSLRDGRGFTLVELLLVLVLMLLLLGAVVFSFSTAQTNAQLAEGAAQFEALLHFARAQAAFTGKRVELRLTSESASASGVAGAATSEAGAVPLRRFEVRWEPDPVQQPGVFRSLEEAAMFLGPMQDLIQVTEIRALSTVAAGEPNPEPLVSSAVTNSLGFAGGSEDSGPEPFVITLFPDGSSDSGEFGLRVPDSDDGRVMWVSLDGITGAIRRRLEVPEDLNRELDRPRRPELAAKSSSSKK